MSRELSDLFKEKSVSETQNFNSIKITLSKSRKNKILDIWRNKKT